MKNWKPFHYIVVVGMLILIGLSWASYMREKRVSDKLKSAQKLTEAETKPITAQDLFNLIKEQFQKNKSQVTVTT